MIGTLCTSGKVDSIMRQWSRYRWGVMASLLSAVTIISLFHRFNGYSPAVYLLGIPSKSSHPIAQLVSQSRYDFDKLRSQQSKKLEEAVTEYQRRYGFSPPPHFDKWFRFAISNGVPIIDEYDVIYDMLLPFWAISPAYIRQSVEEALGAEEFLMRVLVRQGNVTSTGMWGSDENVDAIIQGIAEYLPDMDLIFNLHDEPRVILPHADLSRLVERANSKKEELIEAQKPVRNSWSSSAAYNLTDGDIGFNPLTPFIDSSKEFTWTTSSSGCPLDSPARMLRYDGVSANDSSEAYEDTTLGFLTNRSSFTDICLTPSLEETHGFFQRPNSWSITQKLIPIFTSSKISTFQDILFPSWWYYLGPRVPYEEETDILWENKTDIMYWRGGPTSGYSRHGLWHRQSRQRFVEKVERPGNATILGYSKSTAWTPQEVQLDKNLFNVHLSAIGQCDPADCQAEREFFDIKDQEPQEEAWKYKYLLDMDGNAFSGRYYAFLKSRSLTFKQALWREWHEEWIWPWVHYIPLSFKGTEHLEALRYLKEEVQGRQYAQEIAEESRLWMQTGVRRVDMQAWIFRLLLEYYSPL